MNEFGRKLISQVCPCGGPLYLVGTSNMVVCGRELCGEDPKFLVPKDEA